MTINFQINNKYFLFTVILFAIEILIAVFVHDSFVRPFFGDFLVVIFIFYFFKSFTKISDWNIAWISLATSYLIEYFQYLNILKMLELNQNKLAVIIMGNSFAWEDMVAYTLGILAVLCFEINFIQYYFPKTKLQ
jgi:Protein of unknown function (DUF2809)